MARKRKKKPGSRRKKRSRKRNKSGKQGESAPEGGLTSAPAVEESPPEVVAPPPEAAPDDPDVEIIDLDADTEEPDELARLIADTVAMAPPDDEPIESPAPLIDLDAELEASADEGAAPAEPARAEEVVDQAAPDGAPTDSPGAARDAQDREVEQAAAEALRRLAELGPVSSPEVRSRLLAEALAHAEHKDARYRVPFSQDRAAARWKTLAASLVLLLAAVVAAAPPQWARPDPPATLTVEERARHLRASLLLQAQQVEAFRLREQRLPAALEEMAGALPGLRYVRSGTRAYQLIAYQADGSAIVYDSANPTAAFDSVGFAWSAPEIGP